MNKDQNMERTIIGYDIRKPEAISAIKITSYNEDARYESIYDCNGIELSGINLFIVDPSKIPTLEIPENGRIIAFDLPTSFVISAQKSNVSVPLMLPWFEEMTEWKFLGFDLMDVRTQLSALELYVLDEGAQILDMPIEVNEYGLIENVRDAERFSHLLNNKYSEHAPFIPAGVWLKNHR